MMRSLLLVAIVSLSMTTCEKLNDYSEREGLAGHGGIFSALDWTDYELALISSLHATASYPEIMRIVKEKLIDADISLHERRRIERALKSLRPPPVFNNFLDEDQTKEARKAHGEHRIDDVIGVIASRLGELDRDEQEQAISYMRQHTPE